MQKQTNAESTGAWSCVGRLADRFAQKLLKFLNDWKYLKNSCKNWRSLQQWNNNNVVCNKYFQSFRYFNSGVGGGKRVERQKGILRLKFVRKQIRRWRILKIRVFDVEHLPSGTVVLPSTTVSTVWRNQHKNLSDGERTEKYYLLRWTFHFFWVVFKFLRDSNPNFVIDGGAEYQPKMIPLSAKYHHRIRCLASAATSLWNSHQLLNFFISWSTYASWKV